MTSRGSRTLCGGPEKSESGSKLLTDQRINRLTGIEAMLCYAMLGTGYDSMDESASSDFECIPMGYHPILTGMLCLTASYESDVF